MMNSRCNKKSECLASLYCALGLGLNEMSEGERQSGAEGSGCCAVVMGRCKAKWQSVER